MKKALSLLLAIVLSFGMMSSAAFAQGSDPWQIGTDGDTYATLYEAVSYATAGNTINLRSNYTGGEEDYGANIFTDLTINLNGHNFTLDYSNENLTSNSIGASNGATAIINGNITFVYGGQIANGAVMATDGGNLTINGNVNVSCGAGSGIEAYDNNTSVTINGSLTLTLNDEHGIAGVYTDDGAKVSVRDHITVNSVKGGRGIHARNSAEVNVGKNLTVTGPQTGGILAETDAYVTVGGNTNGEVWAETAASVIVSGNVSDSNGIPVIAGDGGNITVDGSLNGDPFFFDTVHEEVDFDTIDVKTINGYNVFAYTDSDTGAVSTIKVKSTGSGNNDNNNNNNNTTSSSSSSRNSNNSSYTPLSAPTPAPVNTATAVQSVKDAITAAKTSANGATVNLKNVSEISLSTLKEMAKAAGNTALKVSADSMKADGSVDVRITLDPSQATSALNLSASTTSLDAQITGITFAKFFNNQVSVVSLSQKGDFGMPVRVAAKIDAKLNTETLVFYSYDSKTNSYTQIKDPQYKVDKKGYVHFTTALGGEIVISDKPLAKK